MPSLNDLALVRQTADAADPSAEQVLDALSRLAGVRRDLDRLERALIDSARERSLGWPSIAAALGLGSRQAAEQRWLRLNGDATRDPRSARTRRMRQRDVDAFYGATIRDLRSAAAATHRRIEGDPEWDARHPRAVLARTSLEAALTAEAGALFALCTKAVDDLAQVPGDGLSPGLSRAIRDLRRAVDAATPGRPGIDMGRSATQD